MRSRITHRRHMAILGSQSQHFISFNDQDGNRVISLNKDGSVTFGDGSTQSSAASGGTPGGSNTDIQFNNNGAFGGSTSFTWTSGTGLLFLDNTPSIGNGPAFAIGAVGGSPIVTGGLMLTGSATANCEIEIHNEYLDGVEIFCHAQGNFGFRQPCVNFYKSRGTQASSTALGNADAIGTLTFQGYDGTQYGYAMTWSISSSGTWTTSSHGTAFAISTTPLNSTTPSIVWLIDSGHSVIIGPGGPSTSNYDVYLSCGSRGAFVNGNLFLLSNGSAPTSAGTAGTAGEIVYSGTNLYICTVTGAAGAATWNKVNLTAV
jgi:hypothetical protein